MKKKRKLHMILSSDILIRLVFNPHIVYMLYMFHNFLSFIQWDGWWSNSYGIDVYHFLLLLNSIAMVFVSTKPPNQNSNTFPCVQSSIFLSSISLLVWLSHEGNKNETEAMLWNVENTMQSNLVLCIWRWIHELKEKR